MAITLQDKLVVAISSRALFDFEEENRLFEAGDDRAYMNLQLERLDVPAAGGVAMPLVKKLLSFNADARHRVEVVLLSRNDPTSGMRAFRSARHHRLPIERGVFTRGRAPYGYLHSLGAHLFLSANADDVRAALVAGFPAARVYPESRRLAESHPGEVRIAFDGDAVLFSDEAEQIFESQGLTAFQNYESTWATTPLPPGPFKPLLEALHKLREEAGDGMRIRTALVTARSAPAHERAIRTLLAWNVDVDEALFLGGLAKGPFLKEFEPDFYFDDQTGHCESAALAGPTGHVISGIRNAVAVAVGAAAVGAAAAAVGAAVVEAVKPGGSDKPPRNGEGAVAVPGAVSTGPAPD